MAKAKTRIEELIAALYLPHCFGGDTFFQAARPVIEAMLRDTAETPDQRAERLLGKWLVENPGWSYYTSGKSEDYRCRLGRGESGFYSTEGIGPTKASAILDALRKAGCKDV